jgi:adenine-specific DNA-methyltransferase
VRYIGSKTSTLEQLGRLITARVPQGTFCDCFGGIGTVGAHFKSLGYSVWTGDVLRFANFFQIARVQRQRAPSFRRTRAALGLTRSSDVVDELRRATADRGWVVREYSRKRSYFTENNARAIQGCWCTIRRWAKNGWLTSDEYAVLLASLINSMDQVANTAGTYYAFLKTWHRKALKPFRFELIPATAQGGRYVCVEEPAQLLVGRQAFDVLYLDPPYNERSSAHYYHLPETIASGRSRRVRGVAGTPVNTPQRSVFNDRNLATTALQLLLETARFRLLAFHYCDEGLIPVEVARALLAEHGTVEEFQLDSRGYTTRSIGRRVTHRLFLLTHA